MHRCSVFALVLLPLCATASDRHDLRAITGLEVAVRELVETDRMDRTLDALWHAHDTPNTLRGLRLVGDRPRALAKLERRLGVVLRRAPERGEAAGQAFAAALTGPLRWPQTRGSRSRLAALRDVAERLEAELDRGGGFRGVHLYTAVRRAEGATHTEGWSVLVVEGARGDVFALVHMLARRG